MLGKFLPVLPKISSREHSLRAVHQIFTKIIISCPPPVFLPHSCGWHSHRIIFGCVYARQNRNRFSLSHPPQYFTKKNVFIIYVKTLYIESEHFQSTPLYFNINIYVPHPRSVLSPGVCVLHIFLFTCPSFFLFSKE